jgi:hypothetical protein
MTKSNISKSLQKLLKRSDSESDPADNSIDWNRFFASEKAKKGNLTLDRAGEIFITQSLGTKLDEENNLILIVDSLMPTPAPKFWHEPISFHGKLVAIEDGVEEIVTFISTVGNRVEFEGKGAVELINLIDLRIETREYVANLGDANVIELGFIWYGEWFEVNPTAITINRLFFDIRLDGEIASDGYAVPKATIKLNIDTPEIPVKLQIFRKRGGGFEAYIDRIDGLAKQKITSLVDEIWRIASGLSQNRIYHEEGQAGYKVGTHDPLASAFKPHFVQLGKNAEWEERLRTLGEVTVVEGMDLVEVSEKINTGRCDLIVGDAELWGVDAIRVERLLRSVAKLRDLPRIWFSNSTDNTLDFGDNETDEEKETSDDPELGLLDYGAFDIIDSGISEYEIHRRLKWALGGDVLGSGETAVLVSQNKRARYRLALSLASDLIQFITFNRLEGLIPAFQKHKPKWILLDTVSFEVEADKMLTKAVEWADQNGANVIVLSHGAEQNKIADWLKSGAKDIIILDPSLKEAATRLYSRIVSSKEK